MILKWNFAHICSFQKDWNKVVIWKCFLLLHFFGSKMQKSIFWRKKRGFHCSVYQIEVQVISNPTSRLEKKTPNPWIWAYERFFFFFFFFLLKKLIFCIFQYFQKLLNARTKIIVYVLFYVLNVILNTIQLHQPILNIYYFNTGVHYRF